VFEWSDMLKAGRRHYMGINKRVKRLRIIKMFHLIQTLIIDEVVGERTTELPYADQ
jgi:hypothetical protein